jgi:ribonuclease HIII
MAGPTLTLPADMFPEFVGYLKRVGFKFESRPHQVFMARSGKLVVSLYESGKVVIAGVDAQLEKEVRWYLSKLGAAGEAMPEGLASAAGKMRIGTDETGKGDYFGPLVVAGALVDEGAEKKLLALGVRDSKKVSDKRVLELEGNIKRALGEGHWEVLRIDPEKYNRLYSEMGNLNGILAWAHARVIENLLGRNTDCALAVVDEFSARSLAKALMQKGKQIKIVQSVRGERDMAVAAASILARAEFVRRLEGLGRDAGMELPKGATAVEDAAQMIVKTRGKEILPKFAKMHFRTTKKVIDGR